MFKMVKLMCCIKVSNAVDLSNLVQKIQDERAAVALNIFLDRPKSDDLQDLQQMVSNHVDLKRFTLSKVKKQFD
jgi:CHASE2 domain-containing sensor protein